MKTNAKASPFNENGRGSDNSQDNKYKENHSLIKGLDKDLNSIQKEKIEGFPLDILPIFYKDLLSDLDSKLDYAVDYSAAALFFTISVVIGNRIKLRLKPGWLEGANLYQTIVGNPGDVKSHALSFMQRPIQEIEKKLYKEYQQRRAEYEMESESDNSVPKPELKQYLVNDATPEAVLEIHSINEKGVGVSVDEIRSFLKSLNKYRDGNDEELYLSAFSGIFIKINRTTKETILIDDPSVNILGSIQPNLIGSSFGGQKLNNGFIDRFLFYWPRTSKRARWNENEIDQAFVDRYKENIKEIFRFTEKLKTPIELEFTPEAKEFLYQWQNSNPDNFEFDYERGAVVKLEQYVLRFCIILHILKNFSSVELTRVIGKDIVEGAIKLYGYFKNNALRVHEQMNATYYDGMNEMQKKLFQLLPKQFKTGEGVKIARENNLMSERGFKNFIKDKRLFKKISYGVYEKLII